MQSNRHEPEERVERLHRMFGLRKRSISGDRVGARFSRRLRDTAIGEGKNTW